jgi:flagellar hook-associated protein 3 FlgL
MRVTDLTKQNAVLRNIQHNAGRLQNLQETMSSGKRINKLSDDPIGATQALDFRSRISFFDMLKGIMEQTFTWLDRSEAELTHVGDLLSRTKTLVLSQANDSADEASRRVTGEEVQDITDALVQSGNAKIGKIFIFSGSKTLTQPLVEGTATQAALVDSSALENDLKFLLDVEQFSGTFEGQSQHPYLVRITREGPIGRAHYIVSDDGGESWSREKTLLPEIEVYNPDGLSSDKVMLRLPGEAMDKLGEPLLYPSGLTFAFESNPPIAYQGNDDKRRIPTSEGILQPINVTARDIFFRHPDIPDSVNIFDMLVSLKRALVDNDRRVLEERLEQLDHAFDQVLNKRADLGAVRRELEDQLNKISDRTFNNTKQLSEVEDLDFPGAVTEMNLADVRNKATLDTSARLIQPSLLNFLR